MLFAVTYATSLMSKWILHQLTLFRSHRIVLRQLQSSNNTLIVTRSTVSSSFLQDGALSSLFAGTRHSMSALLSSVDYQLSVVQPKVGFPNPLVRRSSASSFHAVNCYRTLKSCKKHYNMPLIPL